MFVTLAILGVFFLAFMLYPGSSNFKSVYFFQEKNANQTKINQQNKNKRTKNNNGNNFSRTKTSKRGKIVYFAFLKKI